MANGQLQEYSDMINLQMAAADQIGVGPMQLTETAMSSHEFSATGGLGRPLFVLNTAL